MNVVVHAYAGEENRAPEVDAVTDSTASPW